MNMIDPHGLTYFLDIVLVVSAFLSGQRTKVSKIKICVQDLDFYLQVIPPRFARWRPLAGEFYYEHYWKKLDWIDSN